MKFFLGVLTGAWLLNYLKTHALLSPSSGQLGASQTIDCGCGSASVLEVAPGATGSTFPELRVRHGSSPTATHPGPQTRRAQVLTGLPNNGLPQNPQWSKRLTRGAPTNLRF